MINVFFHSCFYYFINAFILNIKFTCPVTLDFAVKVGFPHSYPLIRNTDLYIPFILVYSNIRAGAGGPTSLTILAVCKFLMFPVGHSG